MALACGTSFKLASSQFDIEEVLSESQLTLEIISLANPSPRF